MLDNTRSRLSRNEVDRLSELPDPILHKIFSDLPTKQAIRASVLSKRWKDFWVSLPNLSLDLNKAREHGHLFHNLIYKRNRYCRSIDRLHLHVWNYGPEQLDWCIRDAIRGNQIKQFDLTIDLYAHTFSIPSEIFTSPSISIFKLKNLMKRSDLEIFKLPRSLLSAAHLKTLELGNVPMIDSWKVRKLVFSWPVLENLVLVNCFKNFHRSVKISTPQLKTLVVDNVDPDLDIADGDSFACRSVELCVPNLMSFTYRGEFGHYNVKLEKLSKLVSAQLCACFIEKDLQQEEALCMIDVLKRLSNATTLALEELEVYPPEELHLLGKTLTSFTKIITLELTTSIHEAGFIVSKCSCITTLILFLTVELCTSKKYNEEREEKLPWPKQCSLNNLKYVAVRRVHELGRDLRLLRFLLNNAPVLERMTVSVSSWHRDSYYELLKLSRKFPAVELSFNAS